MLRKRSEELSGTSTCWVHHKSVLLSQIRPGLTFSDSVLATSSQSPSGIRRNARASPVTSPRSLMSAAEISGNKKVSVLPALTELSCDGSKGQLSHPRMPLPHLVSHPHPLRRDLPDDAQAVGSAVECGPVQVTVAVEYNVADRVRATSSAGEVMHTVAAVALAPENRA